MLADESCAGSTYIHVLRSVDERGKKCRLRSVRSGKEERPTSSTSHRHESRLNPGKTRKRRILLQIRLDTCKVLSHKLQNQHVYRF